MRRNKRGVFPGTLMDDVLLCIGCGNCREVCPAGIGIPEAIRIYEAYQKGDPEVLSRLNGMDSEGKPIDCIECGACSAHCPQGIDVKKILRTLAMMQSSHIRIPCIYTERAGEE